MKNSSPSWGLIFALNLVCRSAPSRQFVVAKCPPSAVSNDSLPRRAAWHCTPISVRNSNHFIPIVSSSGIFLMNYAFIFIVFYACPNWNEVQVKIPDHHAPRLKTGKSLDVSLTFATSISLSQREAVFGRVSVCAWYYARGRRRLPRAKVSWLVTATFRSQGMFSKRTAYAILSFVDFCAFVKLLCHFSTFV